MKNKVLVICLISLMISLVLVSIVSAFSFKDFFDKITGKAAFQINKNNCTDSDGLNYNVLGNVTMCNRLSCKTYKDSCSGNSKNIIERYCSKTNMATKVYKCPAGCKNGACVINQSTSTSCTDSDGGKNYYVLGNATGATYTGGVNNTINDGCIIGGLNDGWLREAVCEGNVATWSDYKCSAGCTNGACINQTITSNSTI